MVSQRLPFTGRFTVTLDTKHRVILPAPLRKLADIEDPTGDFYLTTHTSGCLRLYTAVGYTEKLKVLRANIDQIEDDDEYAFAERVYERFLHNSHPLRLGEQGRLVIPGELVETTKFEKGQTVHIIGRDDVIEIWEAEAYKREYEMLDENPQRTDDMIRKLNRRRPRRGAED